MKKKLISLFLLFFIFNPKIKSKEILNLEKIKTTENYPYLKIDLSLNKKAGLNLENLTKNNFKIYENGSLLQPFQLEKKQGKVNYNLIFSLDSSKSISPKNFFRLKKAAKRIVKNLEDQDHGAFSNFDDKVYITHRFFQPKRYLIRNINRLKRSGKKTLLFDSLYDGLDFLDETKSKNKAVVCFTDGQDEGSSLREEDVINLAQKIKASLYFITLEKFLSLRNLNRMAILTGGKVFLAKDKKGLKNFFQKELRERRQNYSLWYKTQLPKNSGQQKIKIIFEKNQFQSEADGFFVFKNNKSFAQILYQKRDFVFLGFMILMLFAYLGTIFFFLKGKKEQDQPVFLSKKEDDNFYKNLIKIEQQEVHQQEKSVPQKERPKSWLIYKNGPEVGKEFFIDQETITIGREKGNDLCLSDFSLSAKQAMIKFIKNDYYLFDLISDYGTFLNNRKLLRPKKLFNGDEIQLGNLKYIFRVNPEAEKLEDINYV